jgi:hypothetical protein
MRINLGRRNVSVSEHFLNDAQVCAVRKQMGRKRVPQKMRVHIRLQSGIPGTAFYNLPDPYRGETCSRCRQKQFTAGFPGDFTRAFLFVVYTDGRAGFGAYWNDSGFFAFSRDAQDLMIQIEVLQSRFG